MPGRIQSRRSSISRCDLPRLNPERGRQASAFGNNEHADSIIIKIDDVSVLDRGGGVKTWPLVVRTRVPQAVFTTGTSVYPVGKGTPMHCHNCA